MFWNIFPAGFAFFSDKLWSFHYLSLFQIFIVTDLLKTKPLILYVNHFISAYLCYISDRNLVQTDPKTRKQAIQI